MIYATTDDVTAAMLGIAGRALTSDEINRVPWLLDRASDLVDEHLGAARLADYATDHDGAYPPAVIRTVAGAVVRVLTRQTFEPAGPRQSAGSVTMPISSADVYLSAKDKATLDATLSDGSGSGSRTVWLGC